MHRGGPPLVTEGSWVAGKGSRRGAPGTGFEGDSCLGGARIWSTPGDSEIKSVIVDDDTWWCWPLLLISHRDCSSPVSP